MFKCLPQAKRRERIAGIKNVVVTLSLKDLYSTRAKYMWEWNKVKGPKRLKAAKDN